MHVLCVLHHTPTTTLQFMFEQGELSTPTSLLHFRQKMKHVPLQNETRPLLTAENEGRKENKLNAFSFFFFFGLLKNRNGLVWGERR